MATEPTSAELDRLFRMLRLLGALDAAPPTNSEQESLLRVADLGAHTVDDLVRLIRRSRDHADLLATRRVAHVVTRTLVAEFQTDPGIQSTEDGPSAKWGTP